MVNDRDKYFVFAGKKSSDFGIWASGDAVFNSPMKRYEQIDVPGRNGALIIEDGSFENVELEFKDCFIPETFQSSYNDFKNFMYRQKGYQRLELSWLPDEYRLAHFDGDLDPAIKDWNGYGQFDISFNCKPQRFLKSGEEPITLLPVRSEGLVTFYSPIYKIPSTWDNNIVPADAYSVGITLLRAEGDISCKVRFYTENSDPEYVDTIEQTLTIGERVILAADYATHWQVIFTKDSDEDLDGVQIQLDGFSELITPQRRFSGTLCRVYSVQNPTGFKCKPIIKVYGGLNTLQSVEQVGGDIWTFVHTDYSTLTDIATMDCENEYFYYEDDGIKKNLTSSFTITHMDTDGNTLLASFPELGESETELTVYTMAQNEQTEGMMIQFYPHWFTI